MDRRDSQLLVVNGQRLKLSRSGGAGRYTEQLYNRLISQHVLETDLVDYDVFLPGFQEIDSAGGLLLEEKNPIEVVKYAIQRCCPPVIFDYLQQGYNVFYNRSDGQLQKKQNSLYPSWFSPDVTILVHELTNYGMMNENGRLSLSSNVKFLVSFLDIQDYFYPEYFQDNRLFKRRLAYTFYKDRADLFIAISEFTKQTMVDRLGIAPEKIRVTHLAADDMLILDIHPETENWAQSFGNFWIYPAKAWKHKNHEFLFETIAACQEYFRKAGVTLLLTGGFDKEDLVHFQQLIENNSIADLVKILGFVSTEQLQALIKNAEFLIFPSLFEGFGMPILEAMTLGCPVLSSNAGSLPEVGGDAAEYFDPTDKDQLVSLMESILQGKGTDRDTMIRKGHENCKRFSWDKTYNETVEVYKELL